MLIRGANVVTVCLAARIRVLEFRLRVSTRWTPCVPLRLSEGNRGAAKFSSLDECRVTIDTKTLAHAEAQGGEVFPVSYGTELARVDFDLLGKSAASAYAEHPPSHDRTRVVEARKKRWARLLLSPVDGAVAGAKAQISLNLVRPD